MLVIHPGECIDCALCEPECPAAAIVAEGELDDSSAHWLELNAELATIWPNITQSIPAANDATEWDGKPGKLALLER